MWREEGRICLDSGILQLVACGWPVLGFQKPESGRLVQWPYSRSQKQLSISHSLPHHHTLTLCLIIGTNKHKHRFLTLGSLSASRSHPLDLSITTPDLLSQHHHLPNRRRPSPTAVTAAAPPLSLLPIRQPRKHRRSTQQDMAMRSLLSKTLTALRPLSSVASTANTSAVFRSSTAHSFYFSTASTANTSAVFRSSTAHSFSTRATWSSLNDPSPNCSGDIISLDGCDFKHWLVVLEKPDENMTRDDIIDLYIKTLAKVIGSEEEARMKIYSVSTKHYFAFGALVSEELSNKIKELPGVRWVLPDSYLDVEYEDYGGEPFINGQAVPYDPKYHEEWVRNNAKANERRRYREAQVVDALIKDVSLFMGISFLIVNQVTIEQAKMRHVS